MGTWEVGEIGVLAYDNDEPLFARTNDVESPTRPIGPAMPRKPPPRGARYRRRACRCQATHTGGNPSIFTDPPSDPALCALSIICLRLTFLLFLRIAPQKGS
jgi:hypothetical protein